MCASTQAYPHNDLHSSSCWSSIMQLPKSEWVVETTGVQRVHVSFEYGNSYVQVFAMFREYLATLAVACAKITLYQIINAATITYMCACICLLFAYNFLEHKHSSYSQCSHCSRCNHTTYSTSHNGPSIRRGHCMDKTVGWSPLLKCHHITVLIDVLHNRTEVKCTNTIKWGADFGSMLSE